MPGFTHSMTINAPIANVFAVFSDIEKAPERIKDIKKVELLTLGPVGLGTKFKETRLVFKREASETFEFTVFEPNQRYELVAQSCGAEYRTGFTFTPEGTGTRVDISLKTRAMTLYAKLFSPLAYLMMGMMKKCVLKDFEDLRKVLEANPPATV
jgi:carbon monoxide dehydrogenase subunit G